ncbi:hypothetical protein BKA67DRAFT_207533 [Truncatella angustata]|uniref:Uncharacterized protein n=1 Tax=Truncatella angustata TaxID=152316 RepID=A0A9P8USC9_9PEZI|nr:uncharacterized protein BKA67DRAFT_207533 [Truncatella angustata]KAH6658165.1 hypothetical protein BKA67DRAFT_207533 [Truncatella angustata]
MLVPALRCACLVTAGSFIAASTYPRSLDSASGFHKRQHSECTNLCMHIAQISPPPPRRYMLFCRATRLIKL